MKRMQKSAIPAIFIIVFMAILSLSNLSSRCMYVDESIEAMLGKNVIRYGIPRAWDGENLVLAEVNGNEFNNDFIYVRKNWLSNYIAAFGQIISNAIGLDIYASVGVMRCLFVIIGIAAAIFFYLLCKEFTGNKVAQIVALSLFSFSVPILLYIRSIYYVSPTILFTITTFYAYTKFIKTYSVKSVYIFVISSVLLFHSFYPYFFFTLLTLFLSFLIFEFRKELMRKPVFKHMMAGVLLITFFTMPWFIYSRIFLSTVETGTFVSVQDFFNSVLGYLWQIHAYFFPFLPIILICIIFVVKSCRHSNLLHSLKEKCSHMREKSEFKYIIMSVIQIGINLFAVSLTVNFLDTRRLIGAIPFLFYLFALFISYLIKQTRFIGFTVLLVSLTTNVLHVSPYLFLKATGIEESKVDAIIKPPLPFFNVDQNWLNKKTDLSGYQNTILKAESYFQYYIEEILNDYHDADEGMVRFLNTYAQPNQSVYLVGFQYETIAYYTSCNVVNRLDPNKDPLPSVFKSYPNAEKYQFLTYRPIEKCDWIVERGSNSRGNIPENAIWHDNNLFEKYYIDYPEAKPWGEIWDHSFVTDDSYQGIYIYRNRITTADIELPNNVFYRTGE